MQSISSRIKFLFRDSLIKDCELLRSGFYLISKYCLVPSRSEYTLKVSEFKYLIEVYFESQLNVEFLMHSYLEYKLLWELEKRLTKKLKALLIFAK